MSILVLHSSSDLYGASKILLQTVSFLSSRGNKVVVVLSEEGPLADAFVDNGVKVYIVRLGILRRKYFNVKGLINRAITIRNAINELSAIIDREGIETIYSNTTGVLAGAFVARKKRIRHIWHIHEIITKPVFFLKVLGFLVNKFSDKVIVVSNAVADHWRKLVSDEKIEVVYNGIEYGSYLMANGKEIRSDLKIHPTDCLIGMIGRVHYWKGQSYFLQIAKHITDEFPNVKFVMVGDAFPGYEYLYKEISNKIGELNIDDSVINLGYRKDIPNILAALDIFVLPSILPDPLPTVVLEAMASAKPVIATAHGGAVEMVDDGVTGKLIPWDNASQAAGTILSLLKDKAILNTMGQKGRERVLTYFSEEAYFQNIEKVIFSLQKT